MGHEQLETRIWCNQSDDQEGSNTEATILCGKGEHDQEVVGKRPVFHLRSSLVRPGKEHLHKGSPISTNWHQGLKENVLFHKNFHYIIFAFSRAKIHTNYENFRAKSQPKLTNVYFSLNFLQYRQNLSATCQSRDRLCENILLTCELGNFSAKIFVFAQKLFTRGLRKYV